MAYARLPNHPAKLRIARWLRWALRIDDVIALTSRGVLMQLDFHDLVQYQIILTGGYEHRSLQCVLSLLSESSVFVDVGSHVGQYALHASTIVGASGKVVAIEPNPRTFLYLRRNLKLNGDTTVVPVLGAISREFGLVTMTDPPLANWGASRVASPKAGGYVVSGYSLGYLFAGLRIQSVDVIKIDVEGYELEVLEGLFASVQSMPKHIVLEYIPGSFAGADAALECLLDHGYSLFEVTGEPYSGGRPVEDNVWARLC